MPIVKLSREGKITIPPEYRKLLGTDIVEISYEDGKVVLKPIKSLGGVLSKFALKGKSVDEIQKLEKEAIKSGFTEREN